MQGQRGKMVSMPETFEIDRASSSSGAQLDQQLCWSDLRGPPETHFPGFMVPANENSIPFMSSISHEQRNVSGWSLGEASSSSGPYGSSNGEWKVESGWPSRHGPRVEDQRFGPSNSALSLDNTSIINPMFVQGSGSTSIPLNVNSNGEYVGPSGENPSPLMENPNLYKSSGSNNNNNNYPFIASGSDGYVREESEVRLGGSLDGRRVPCKRKSFEGHVGQSSFVENPSFPQPMDSSPWNVTPPCFNMSSGPSPSTHPAQEQMGPRLGLDLSGGVIPQTLPDRETTNISNSNRSFRLRVNSLSQNGTSLPNSLSSSSMVGGGASTGIPLAPQSSSRLVVPNRSLELPPPSALTGPAPQRLHPLLQVPVMAPGGHSVRWSRGLVPRNPDEGSSSGGSRNMLQQQHPMLVSSLSSSSTRGLVGAGSSGFPGNSNSAPLGSSSSAATQLPHTSSAPQPTHHHHSRYPRRWSEYVRRQLMSSIGSDSGQGSQTSNSLGQPVLPQDVLVSSGHGSSSGHHRQSTSRSALWMDRQGDSVIGIPYPVRTLASASEGRRRFASEIRSVLELVRRGQGGLRVEDVMILDPSVFFGVADMHDRHRDMRLDVDNMSYEELLALEERIGNVSTGLNEETILARMKQRKHSDIANTQMEAEPCCICQEEYKDGEDIGTLECGHDFHRDCVKQWLMQKNLCPICKTTGLTT